LQGYYNTTNRSGPRPKWGAARARRGSPTPPKPLTKGLPRDWRPSVGRVARSETGHSNRTRLEDLDNAETDRVLIGAQSPPGVP
jgi:hypothetical protein